MKVNVRRPLKRRSAHAAYQNSAARAYAHSAARAYAHSASDNEEELLKKMNKLVVKAEAQAGAGIGSMQGVTSFKRFAAGFKSSSKISKPKTFAL